MGLKPMNCPGHVPPLRGCSRWSYRDLPIRFSRAGPAAPPRAVSGTLHGLMRVRHFAQDDAHIFCTEDQIQDEVARCLDFGVRRSTDLFGFEPHARALDAAREARSAPTSCGTAPRRALAERARAPGPGLRGQRGRRRVLRPEDRPAHDATRSGRSWQLGTVQLDYYVPERFGLDLHRRRQRRAPAGDDPPRAVRLLRALHRDPASSTTPASCRCGWRRSRRSCCRSPTATTRRAAAVARRAARRRACASRSTTAPSRSGARSARPSSQDPVHARRRRPRGRGGHGRRAPPRRGRPRHRRAGVRRAPRADDRRRSAARAPDRHMAGHIVYTQSLIHSDMRRRPVLTPRRTTA